MANTVVMTAVPTILSVTRYNDVILPNIIIPHPCIFNKKPFYFAWGQNRMLLRSQKMSQLYIFFFFAVCASRRKANMFSMQPRLFCAPVCSLKGLNQTIYHTKSCHTILKYYSSHSYSSIIIRVTSITFYEKKKHFGPDS